MSETNYLVAFRNDLNNAIASINWSSATAVGKLIRGNETIALAGSAGTYLSFSRATNQ
jgi:hypothetical protein